MDSGLGGEEIESEYRGCGSTAHNRPTEQVVSQLNV